ncbi:single-stranded DNA-binding protein [Pseudovibrio ascidiaceicola]|uniref:single-stranded DNA-binding protein n=1 Tax=Pseudovibrio ascidiaceicola TaxID=285279 RepID=UPI003D36AB7A
MSFYLNKVMLAGNLGADVTVSTTTGGSKVAKLRLATNSFAKNADGSNKTYTEWHQVEIWGDKRVEYVQNKVGTGSNVYIEGESRTEQWDDGNGNTRSATKIVVTGSNSVFKVVAAGNGEKNDPQLNSQDSGYYEAYPH